MAKQSGSRGAGNPKRKTGVVRGRRALNAFRVDKEDLSRGAMHEERILEDSDEGVKSEDDEDIDSDEAFDEEDKERFSAFKFSGSSSRQNMVRFCLEIETDSIEQAGFPAPWSLRVRGADGRTNGKFRRPR